MLFHYSTFKGLVFSSRNKELEITTGNNNKHLQILGPNYVGWDFGSLPLSSCVTWRKLLNLSGPQSLHLEKKEYYY